MEIRVAFSDGKARFETLSALEDLWHDYQFFAKKGLEVEQSPASPADAFVAKRYYRAALLALVAYFEGVLNRWLKQLLKEPEWQKVERKYCVDKKIDLVHQQVSGVGSKKPSIEDAKGLRNSLMHLKPGTDGNLYDAITGDLLARTEAEIDAWLTEIERCLGFKRHLDSREESRPFREALGRETPGSEGYSGDL